tara:strand:- start:542 stop:781 length:240 start_codon:yes stop_codon:yes gene_type:complete
VNLDISKSEEDTLVELLMEHVEDSVHNNVSSYHEDVISPDECSRVAVYWADVAWICHLLGLEETPLTAFSLSRIWAGEE